MYQICHIPTGQRRIETFSTTDEGWEFIFNHCMCTKCKKELKNFIDGVEEDPDNGIFSSCFPACACEWDVESITPNNEDIKNTH